MRRFVMKKALALIAVLVFCVAFFPAAEAAPAKPNVTVTVDKTTVAVGETVHVSWAVTGNYDLGPYGDIYGFWIVSYESDYTPDPVPATGSDSFTPEEPGTLTYVILVDWDDEIYDSYVEYASKTITVTKTPSATVAKPSGVKAASAGYDKIKLNWNPVSCAAGYQIYRATSKSGTYSKVTTITGGTKNTYTNSGLTTGKTYYYKIRAYKKAGSSTIYGSYSSVAGAKPVPAVPSGVKAASAGSNKIKLKWNPVSGATGYQIYRATSKSGTYIKVAAITGRTNNTYTNTGLTKGKTYYYKVRAYKKVGSSNVYGSFSGIVHAAPK
jgi:uncharacterized protein YfiM (DUF2279 family)